MIYNALYETGDCQQSLWLGCKECKNCQIKAYEKEKAQLQKEEDAQLEAQLEKEWDLMEEEEQKRNKEIFNGEYEGIFLNRWSREELKCINEVINDFNDAYIKIIHKDDNEFFTYMIILAEEHEGEYYTFDVYY